MHALTHSLTDVYPALQSPALPISPIIPSGFTQPPHGPASTESSQPALTVRAGPSQPMGSPGNLVLWALRCVLGLNISSIPSGAAEAATLTTMFPRLPCTQACSSHWVLPQRCPRMRSERAGVKQRGFLPLWLFPDGTWALPPPVTGFVGAQIQGRW